MHDSTNGNALIEQTSDGVCVVGREQNKDFALLCLFQNFGRDSAVHGDDKTGDAAFEELQQSFGASVADKDDIFFVEDADR